jgi:tRNA A37 threonylcarbamoyladenosine biosynthesis protein TsaE
VEWSERIDGFIPAEALRVDFELTGDNERRIHVYKKGLY